MQAQEALIKKLQERHEAEKLGRSRAQLALAEKTTSLHGCFVDKEKLQAASEKCSASLMAAAGQQQQAPAATAA